MFLPSEVSPGQTVVGVYVGVLLRLEDRCILRTWLSEERRRQMVAGNTLKPQGWGRRVGSYERGVAPQVWIWSLRSPGKPCAAKESPGPEVRRPLTLVSSDVLGWIHCSSDP